MNLNNETKIIITAIFTLYVIIFILFLMTPVTGVLSSIVRLCALLGFTSMFIATMMSAFMVRLYKIFKKPFIKLHHYFSILGIVLATIHPIAYAIQVMNIAVFVPVFYPWYDFWELAGRPALILIYIALFAVLLKKKIPKYWKPIHALNYVVLLFANVHGILIGTDFKNIGILIIFNIMVWLSYISLGYKTYQNYQRKQRKKQRQVKNDKILP